MTSEPLLGVAALARMAFSGVDLSPLSDHMLDRVGRNPEDADALMDLSVILQILSKPRTALVLQEQALGLRRIYHLDAPKGHAEIRLLAFMTCGDLMANAPIDFLLEDSGVSLDMVYVTADLPMPEQVPDHDVAIVAVADSDENLPVLEELQLRLETWPRPVLNMPAGIMRTTREATKDALDGAENIEMPPQIRLLRTQVEELAQGGRLPAALGQAGFPIIVRPTGSHAGHGLDQINAAEDLLVYLAEQPDDEFYLSPFVDYRSRDGLYRKYRVVLIDGKPYAAHMAISSNWMVHYLNAGMTESAEKRREEEQFMVTFDADFGRRHADAFTSIYRRFELDYLVIDCAETADGKLLVFEVDAGAVVHAMDPADMFPYKHVQMRKVFDAFHDMLSHRITR